MRNTHSSTFTALAGLMLLASFGSACAEDVYRFWSDDMRSHFYTANAQERDNVIATLPQWRYEGPAWSADTTVGGALPVYRFQRKDTGRFFFTISELERDTLLAQPARWEAQGIGWYAYAVEVPGLQPVYRFWNGDAESHFYTISEEEKDTIIATLPEWQFEGVAWYAKPPSDAGAPFTPGISPIDPSLPLPRWLLDLAAADLDDGDDEASADELDQAYSRLAETFGWWSFSYQQNRYADMFDFVGENVERLSCEIDFDAEVHFDASLSGRYFVVGTTYSPTQREDAPKSLSTYCQTDRQVVLYWVPATDLFQLVFVDDSHFDVYYLKTGVFTSFGEAGNVFIYDYAWNSEPTDSEVNRIRHWAVMKAAFEPWELQQLGSR